MSKEITLADLAEGSPGGGGGGGAAAAGAGADDDSTAEWILELYDRLEDDGLLQAILFGPDALPDGADVPTPARQNGQGHPPGTDVDAEVVADALEDVQNTVGDLRVSQLVTLIRQNPDLVDELLAEHLAADVDAGPDELEPDEPEGENED